MLRSPWLGPLAIAIAGVVGYVLSDGNAEAELESVTITIKDTRENGAKWDFGGGLPDPRVRVERASVLLATCEAKDQLKVTCNVGATITEPARVVVVDVDSSDDDPIGEASIALDGASTTTGALHAVEVALVGGGGPWRRFRALWIALAIGVAVAGALSVYRRRHA